MTLTIGRASGLLPDSLSMDGDTLNVSGIINGATEDVFKARRQQLLGLVDNDDEDVFPVVYASDSTFDGYYRVSSVSVEPFTIIHNGVGRFSAQLRRVPGYRVPLVESVYTSVLLENSHSITSATGLMCVPQAGPIGITTTPAASRSTETGAVWVTELPTLVSTSLTDTQSYIVPASSYYNGSATVETSVGGSWYPLVGQQAIVSAGSVRLNNGVLRLTVSAAAVLTMDVWNGSAWEAASTGFKIVGGGGDLDTPSEIRVLRNSPESAAIRMQLVYSLTAASSMSVTLDISLRRGARHVDCLIPIVTEDVAVHAVTNTACTSITTNGYFRQTSNDANGNRFVVGGPVALTSDLTNGRYSAVGIGPAANVIPFMLGMELDGSSAGALSTAAAIRDQHICQVTAEQRVQVR